MWFPVSDLVHVRLLGFPLDVYSRASEHHEELMREFQLLAIRPPDGGHEVPRRLIQLVQEVNDRYAGTTDMPNKQRDEALARGERRVDLDYEVPTTITEDVVRVGQLLDEADEYCRQGELLTLATPPEYVRFRRWLFGEFGRQLQGEEPLAWDAFPA